MRLIYIATFICLSIACANNSENEEIVAQVGNTVLLKEEVPEFELKEDSSELRAAFIDSWIKKQLLVEKALINLTEQQANFDKQLEDYKNSLLIYAFENKLVKQKLDTNLSESAIQSYYSENEDNFKLRENYVNAKIIQFINTAPKSDSVKIWLEDKNGSFDYKVNEFCSQFATSCILDTLAWLPFTKIKDLTELPADKNLYLSEGLNSFSDSLQTLLVMVAEIKKVGDISPISLVRNDIKGILLNKRKIQLINEVKEEIFESATLNEEYEIYK